MSHHTERATTPPINVALNWTADVICFQFAQALVQPSSNVNQQVSHPQTALTILRLGPYHQQAIRDIGKIQVKTKGIINQITA
ncbi:MAG: hypothetical protein KA368_18130 [Acidobacteria bacterium]|nr:hypothetical protein [Acidobacteriota bacterium]